MGAEEREEPRGAGWSFVSEDEYAALTRDDREVHWDGLGEGWESVEAALALIQADLSRTVVGAPTLGLAWYVEDGERTLFVGKGLDWYQGMTPLYLEGEDLASATVLISDALQDAIVDGLLGPRTFWPKCPSHGQQLDAMRHGSDEARWCCPSDGRSLGVVGQLRLDQA